MPGSYEFLARGLVRDFKSIVHARFDRHTIAQ